MANDVLDQYRPRFLVTLEFTAAKKVSSEDLYVGEVITWPEGMTMTWPEGDAITWP